MGGCSRSLAVRKLIPGPGKQLLTIKRLAWWPLPRGSPEFNPRRRAMGFMSPVSQAAMGSIPAWWQAAWR